MFHYIKKNMSIKIKILINEIVLTVKVHEKSKSYGLTLSLLPQEINLFNNITDFSKKN